MVESGLAQVMTFKGDAERSVDFEVLLMAESKAKAAHKGLYSYVSVFYDIILFVSFVFFFNFFFLLYIFYYTEF